MIRNFLEVDQASIQSLELDGLLYAIVIRPPEFLLKDEYFTSDALSAVSLNSEGAQLVVEGNFVAVAAPSYDAARAAAQQVEISWISEREPQGLPLSGAATNTISDSCKDSPDFFEREYSKPNRWSWGVRPQWTVARKRTHKWTIWANTGTENILSRDLSDLLDCAIADLEICGGSNKSFGRTCVDDAAADAAFISSKLERPVAVLLDDQYDEVAQRLGYSHQVRISSTHDPADSVKDQLLSAWSGAPVLALLLTNSSGFTKAHQSRQHWPYQIAHTEVSDLSKETPVYWDSLAAVQHDVFARESFLDELADSGAACPIQFRLARMTDQRGRDLLESCAQQASWQFSPSRPVSIKQQDLVSGRGVAYTSTASSTLGNEATRAAWIVDVDVNTTTGDVNLTRAVIGQDAGPMREPRFIQNDLTQELIQSAGSLLLGSMDYDQWGNVDSCFDGECHELVSTSDSQQLSAPPGAQVQQTCSKGLVSEPLSMAPGLLNPAVAAIANAIYNATGVRFRSPPFSSHRLRHELSRDIAGQARKVKEKNTQRGRILGVGVAIVGAAALYLPWQSAISPVSRPASNLYSDQTIERGRLVAEAGDCAVCHTVTNGNRNSGGRPFETPFGTVYSTNLTPDEANGIGRWSFAAFDRAMRQGVSRDGRHLYPVFPYTAFAKISHADMQALYAYLMAQDPVDSSPSENDMRFPMNYRGLLAGWKALNHSDALFKPDASQSALWNRGAYLAEGLGHCSACHTPRNLLGAEKQGVWRYSGAMVDGWEAPALNQLSRSPIPWTEDDLFVYLSEGQSERHGVAGGPMMPVVAGLAELPESDVRAIAHYVASLSNSTLPRSESRQGENTGRQTAASDLISEGEAIFESGCSSCHGGGETSMFTASVTSLERNTNVFSATADNVIQTILYGVQDDTFRLSSLGVMPGFAESLSDAQIEKLVHFIRYRYAPNLPAWSAVRETIARQRQHTVSY